jgi:hypothetical protein
MDAKQIDSILRELASRRLIKKAEKQDGKKENIWVRYDAADK